MFLIRLGAALLLASSLAVGSAQAQKATPLKIGVLTDMSGNAADLTGEGSVVAARLAVEDFKGKAGGRPIEVVFADHQNKPDVGSSLARNWLASGVDVILDVPNSAVALAVNSVVREANKVMLTGAASTAFLDDACSPNTIVWALDTWSLPHGTTTAVVADGGKKWFFITSDYVAGTGFQAGATKFLEAAGGKVVGSVRTPLNTADYSSYLLQAQASGADVIGLAMAGNDPINAIKQAAEFQITKTMKLAPLSFYITDVRSMGLKATQGLYVTDAFYWDMNPNTRKFSARFGKAFKGLMPTLYHAATYSAVIHYLKTMDKMKGASTDGMAVVKQMKAMPTDDLAFGKGTIRAADNRKLHPVYTFQIKKPEESKGEWDLYKLVKTFSVTEGWRPVAESKCKLPN